MKLTPEHCDVLCAVAYTAAKNFVRTLKEKGIESPVFSVEDVARELVVHVVQAAKKPRRIALGDDWRRFIKTIIIRRLYCKQGNSVATVSVRLVRQMRFLPMIDAYEKGKGEEDEVLFSLLINEVYEVLRERENSLGQEWVDLMLHPTRECREWMEKWLHCSAKVQLSRRMGAFVFMYLYNRRYDGIIERKLRANPKGYFHSFYTGIYTSFLVSLQRAIRPLCHDLGLA